CALPIIALAPVDDDALVVDDLAPLLDRLQLLAGVPDVIDHAFAAREAAPHSRVHPGFVDLSQQPSGDGPRLAFPPLGGEADEDCEVVRVVSRLLHERMRASA